MSLQVCSRNVRLALVAVALGVAPFALGAQDNPELLARARTIHDRVITMDTHVDMDPKEFTPATPNYVSGTTSQVDLPKMTRGGLDAIFLSIYVGQRPDLTDAGFRQAMAGVMEKFEAVHRLTERLAPDRIQLALTADDVRRIHAAGRKIALMGVENGYAIGQDIANVKRFHDLGGRYLSLAHNGHNQLSDSNVGERDGVWKWNGLSPLGRRVVAEANRVGLMLDISHPSKASIMQTLELTRAPVIASHSSVRALCDVSRNLDDEQLRAVAKNGGVVQIVAFSGYLRPTPPDSPDRARALTALRAKFGFGGAGGRDARSDPAAFAAYQREMAELNVAYPPPPRATVKDFANHIDYAVKLMGIDHVGMSSDFDGGGGIEGYQDASEAFNVTLELVRRGYTEEQIAKLWGGNLLRVMGEVERVAKQQQASSPS